MLYGDLLRSKTAAWLGLCIGILMLAAGGVAYAGSDAAMPSPYALVLIALGFLFAASCLAHLLGRRVSNPDGP